MATTPKDALMSIRRTQLARKITLEQAARIFAINDKEGALSVMEEIGSFPSSEPELEALQAIWPIR